MGGSVKLDLEEINGKYFLLLKPMIWVWPKRARIQAADFLDRRGGGRFNEQADALLSAWIHLLLPRTPSVRINSRTAFSRRAIA